MNNLCMGSMLTFIVVVLFLVWLTGRLTRVEGGSGSPAAQARPDNDAEYRRLGILREYKIINAAEELSRRTNGRGGRDEIVLERSSRPDIQPHVRFIESHPDRGVRFKD